MMGSTTPKPRSATQLASPFAALARARQSTRVVTSRALQVICRQMGIRGASRAISKPLYEQNRDGYIYDASYAKVEDMWKVR